MDFDKLVFHWAHWGLNNELLKSSNQDFQPPISDDEVEDTATKEADATKEEKESPFHGVALGNYKDDHIKVDLEDLDGTNE